MKSPQPHIPKKDKVLQVVNQSGTVFNALVALDFYHLVYTHNKVAEPQFVEAPTVTDPLIMATLTDKLLTVGNARHIALNEAEAHLFYQLLHFAASCLVSEQDDFFEEHIKTRFGQKDGNVNHIKTFYLQSAEQIIALLNEAGFNPNAIAA